MDLSGSFWFRKRDKTKFHQAMVKTCKSEGLKEVAKSTFPISPLISIFNETFENTINTAPSHFLCRLQAPRLVLLLAPSGTLIAFPTY